MTMVSAEVSLGLCGRETYGYPPTVLRQGGAERGPFASSSQARGRGSPRRPCATITVSNGAGAGVQSTGREQGSGPMRSCAFADAVRRALQSARLRLTPGTSRAACGAPAPLTTDGATCAERRPFGALTCSQQLELIDEPGRSTPCPCQVFSLRGRDPSGPQEWRVKRARPLPRRPL